MTQLLLHYGYPAILILLLLGIVGLPVPDETLLTFCGFLIYSGRLNPGLTFLTAICGSAGGISVSYVLGTRFGHRAVKYVRLSPALVSKTEQMFLRFGPFLLTIGYFIPGVRHFTAVVAGMAQLRFRKFALFAYLGAVIWVSLFLTLGYIFGNGWQHTSDLVHRYTLIATGGCAIAIVVVWLVRYLRSRFRS